MSFSSSFSSSSSSSSSSPSIQFLEWLLQQVEEAAVVHNILWHFMSALSSHPMLQAAAKMKAEKDEDEDTEGKVSMLLLWLSSSSSSSFSSSSSSLPSITSSFLTHVFILFFRR